MSWFVFPFNFLVWSSVVFWTTAFTSFYLLPASSTQRWWTHQYVKSKLHGRIIELSPSISLFCSTSKPFPYLKCFAELLRCYTVTVQVWILSYKSSEPWRPTKRNSESPNAVCAYVQVCGAFVELGVRLYEMGKLNVSHTQQITIQGL